MAVPRARIFEMMSRSHPTVAKEIANNNVLTGIANLRTSSRLQLLRHQREWSSDRAAAETQPLDIVRRSGYGPPRPAEARGGAQPTLSGAVK